MNEHKSAWQLIAVTIGDTVTASSLSGIQSSNKVGSMSRVAFFIIFLSRDGLLWPVMEDGNVPPYPRLCYHKIYTVSILGAIVEDVRTVFERINDATIYIPSFTLNTIGPCALG